MKRLSKSPSVLAFGAWLVGAYFKLVYLTVRWQREEEARVTPLWNTDTGVIVCMWHARILLAGPCWDRKRGAQDPKILISNSKDGEIITKVAKQLGFGAIRGSRQRSDSVGEKGGDKAYREMLRWVAEGGGIAITPDGPAGPAEVIGVGAPSLARLTGAPVMLLGVAANPCWRLKTWDRTIIPRLFGRGAIVWDGPFHVGRGDDLAQVAEDWTKRLAAVTARAEALSQ